MPASVILKLTTIHIPVLREEVDPQLRHNGPELVLPRGANHPPVLAPGHVAAQGFGIRLYTKPWYWTRGVIPRRRAASQTV